MEIIVPSVFFVGQVNIHHLKEIWLSALIEGVDEIKWFGRLLKGISWYRRKKIVGMKFCIKNYEYFWTIMEILIVDDDLDDCEILAELIAEILPDVTCLTAINCERCLELVQESAHRFSFIFMDGKLPGMSTNECLDKLKVLSSSTYTKIILYTGYSAGSVVNESLRHGADLFLHKTGSTNELRARLSEIFSSDRVKS